MAPIRGDDRVRIQGLDELRRELRRLQSSELQGELKDANYRIASHVADKAKSRLSGLGRMEARAAQTIGASRAQAGAQIRFGGPAAPFAGGAEFGANRDVQRTRSTGTYVGYRQFVDTVKGGRSIYPTVGEENEWMVNEYGEAFERIAARAFPERA